MSFVWAAALAGLLLVPAALAAYLLVQRRRARYAVRFTNLDLLSNLVEESPRWRRHVPPALFLVALAALVVAVARPELTRKEPEQASVVLALDTSGSMQATDVEPTRLAAAQEAAETFLESVPDDLPVGLVTFSDGAHVLVQPTTDHDSVRAALGTLQADGGTAIGDAIAAATQIQTGAAGTTLAADRPGTAEQATQVVVLLSDGAPSPDTLDPEQAAREAKASGIAVSTVALGTDQGTVEITDEMGFTETIPVPPDRETLSRIAELTGGTFFDAPSQGELERVYEQVAGEVGYTTEQVEVAWIFAGLGALLVLAAGGLSLVWFNRLP
ncbi:MAG: VWA domain-containing protein [Gaiellales bacterium]